MSLSLYKPTAKNTGCGFSLQLGVNNKTQECALYIKAIKQYSWDDNKKQGYFHQNSGDPDKNIVVKFNEYEIGSLIHSLTSRIEYTTFHTFNEDKTVIKLSPWDKKSKKSVKNPETGTWEEKLIPVRAYSLSFTRNGNQNFSISLEPGEACSINEYFKFCLHNIYTERFNKEQLNIKGKKHKDETRPPF